MKKISMYIYEESHKHEAVMHDKQPNHVSMHVIPSRCQVALRLCYRVTLIQVIGLMLLGTHQSSHVE